MKHIASVLISALALISSPAAAQSTGTWNSRLLPNLNGSFTPQTVNFAARNWTLDDFSYAGYYLGAKSPGLMPFWHAANANPANGRHHGGRAGGDQ